MVLVELELLRGIRSCAFLWLQVYSSCDSKPGKAIGENSGSFLTLWFSGSGFRAYPFHVQDRKEAHQLLVP